MATSLPCCSSCLMSSILASGVACQEVVHAGLLGDDRRGERVVARDHHCTDAHRTHLVEPFADAALDDVFEMDHPEGAVVAGHGQWRAALLGDVLHGPLELGRNLAALLADPGHHGVAGPLADGVPVEVDAAHAVSYTHLTLPTIYSV